MTAQSDTLLVWTIQPEAVWKQLEMKGVLTVDSRYVGNLHHCYEWLRARLARAIPGYRGHYPWWAYCGRPDLRTMRHQQPRGQRCYRIELALPRQAVFDFPFWAWDAIFNGQFLSPTQRESEDWHRRAKTAVPDWGHLWPIPEPWLSELEKSWESLFDPSLPNRGWFKLCPSCSEREAVFEVLDLSHVRRITGFLGSNARCSPREISVTGCGEPSEQRAE